MNSGDTVFVLTSAALVIRRSHPMKRIEAIIKPFKLDDVKDGLSGLGVRVQKSGSVSVSAVF